MDKSDLDFGRTQTSWGYLHESNDHLIFGLNSGSVPEWTGSSRLDIGFSQMPEPLSGGYGDTADGGTHPHPLSPQDLIYISADRHLSSDVKAPSFAKAGPAGGTTATPEWFTP